MPKVTSSLRKVRPRKNELESSESNWASENEKDNISSFLRKTNKINRWISLMNKSDNINLAFLKILGEIEDNIIEHFQNFEQDINKVIERALQNLQKQGSETLYNSEYIKELRRILEVPLPITDLETFEIFDDDLEDNCEKQDALRKLLWHSISGNKNITRDIFELMNTVTTKSVQPFFTATGKKHAGQSKKAFCLTNVYICMQDVLVDKYKQSAEELELTLKFSRWLTQTICRIEKLKNKKIK